MTVRAWSKRGFTVLYGVVVVMSWDSGKMLVYEVVSRHCSEFACWDDADLSSDEYSQWYIGHKDQCTQNFVGSAPAIEAEGVLRTWHRSESRLGLCYTHIISDGDSKVFAALHDSRPYGKIQVVKHECVGHVQKRVVGYLGDLIKDKTLNDADCEHSKFACHLTDASIDNLQKYYGNAIRANVGNVIRPWNTLNGLSFTTPAPTRKNHNPNTALWAQISGALIFMQPMRVKICRILSLLESPQILQHLFKFVGTRFVIENY